MDNTLKPKGTAPGPRRRDLLQGILSTSVSAIMIADPDGFIHFANQRATEVLGVPMADVIGRSCMDPAWSAETPDGHPLALEAYPFNIVRRTGRALDNARMSVLDATGQRRQLSLNAAPVPGSEDIVFSIVDITAEEDMKAARNRLLEILEATPDFVSMSDLDHNVVYMNAAARRTAGLPPSAAGALGFDMPPGSRRAGAWLHPAWAMRKITEEGIPTAMREGVWEGETALLDKNGGEIAMSQVILAHTDGQGRVDRLSTLMRDISDQRRARREMTEAAARLERVLHVNPSGIYALRLDPDAPGTAPVGALISQTMVDISGRSMDDWMADPHGVWLSLIHPDDRARVMADQTILNNTGLIEHEYRITPPGKHDPVWIFDRVVLLRDAFDRPAEIIGAWLDISHRHAMEEELRRSNADLEQFAYVTSHDLQEPLRMVSAYLGLLRRRLGNTLDAEASEFITFAVDGAQRMHHMINDLLSYSRVGRMGAPFTQVDSATALHAAEANLHKAITDSGARIVVEGPPLPLVWADGAQLGRLFQNLIGNALKYSRPESPPVITITAEEVRDGWQFSVRDNGIGIERKDFNRIFQIFQRLHPRGPADGTGIGLSICKRIVERHGGRIWLESTPGEGTTFTFTLARPR